MKYKNKIVRRSIKLAFQGFQLHLVMCTNVRSLTVFPEETRAGRKRTFLHIRIVFFCKRNVICIYSLLLYNFSLRFRFIEHLSYNTRMNEILWIQTINR